METVYVVGDSATAYALDRTGKEARARALRSRSRNSRSVPAARGLRLGAFRHRAAAPRRRRVQSAARASRVA
eukprot:9123542-Alexandrium_andersonii.AAC.1